MCLLEEPERRSGQRFSSGAVKPIADPPGDDTADVVETWPKRARKTKPQPDWLLDEIPRIIELPVHIDSFLDMLQSQLRWKLTMSQATRQILQELASQV